MTIFRGTHHDDVFDGTSSHDTFILHKGGDDIASGHAGKDLFKMGAAFNALDQINGGKNGDTVVLAGDYSGANALVFNATTMNGVEVLKLHAGFSYDLTTADATVAAGQNLKISASNLGSGDTLHFDGSAETDGRFIFDGGAGNDVITGGAGNDTFRLFAGGSDHVNGGAGDDLIQLGAMTTQYQISGGSSGYDILEITGAQASDTVSFFPSTMTGIDKLVLTQSNIFDVLTADQNVAAGATLEVDLTASTSNYSFNGQQETDGHFNLMGGSGIGLLRGGAQSDTISVVAHATGGHVVLLTGGGGSDDITCNAGLDRVTMTAVSDSTSTGRDVVHAFDANLDQFDLTSTVSAVGASPLNTNVSEATFDANIGSVGDDALPGNAAWIVHASGGDLIGHDFLVVDTNNNNSYNAGTDYVIDITGFTGTLDTGDFI